MRIGDRDEVTSRDGSVTLQTPCETFYKAPLVPPTFKPMYPSQQSVHFNRLLFQYRQPKLGLVGPGTVAAPAAAPVAAQLRFQDRSTPDARPLSCQCSNRATF